MENEKIRASDFQDAWPHAYQLAMEQVAALQRTSDYLAAMIAICIDKCKNLSDQMNAANLEVANTVTSQIKIQATKNEKLFEQAVIDLKKERQQLSKERAEFIERMENMNANLLKQKRDIASREKAFMLLPVWKRIWMAALGTYS
jgi:septin family protein